jgi:hypothetical protein
MKTEIFISIVAATSALLGSLIPTIINYLNNRNQNRFEVQRTLLEKQKEVYNDLLFALQYIMNNPTDPNAFREFQKSVNQISIYGDNNTAVSVNNYYRELVSISRNKRVLLTQEEHKTYQEQIVNGMRKHLGLSTFEDFELVAFQPLPKESTVGIKTF